ncbi:MAG: hypothetical protein ACXVJD_13125 [Mucilaginibacter sp.]
MENNISVENQNREISQIQANAADEYWTKKYDVSPEELKEKQGSHIGIIAKILEVTSKKKVFSY